MANLNINLSEIDLNSLDFNEIGSWPMVGKAIVIVFLCTVAVGLGYWFDTRVQLDDLKRAEQREIALKKEFETKYTKAARLDAYKAQMKEMEESFGTMLRQLPSGTEVADLLVDVTQTGLAAGLKFDLFKPRKEEPKEFYAELPIDLAVQGDYHEIGHFVSGVAALPRIVTLHDFTITASGPAGTPDRLKLEATAKTYRYLDDKEMAAARRR